MAEKRSLLMLHIIHLEDVDLQPWNLSLGEIRNLSKNDDHPIKAQLDRIPRISTRANIVRLHRVNYLVHSGKTTQRETESEWASRTLCLLATTELPYFHTSILV